MYEPRTKRFAEGIRRLRNSGATLADRAKAIVIVTVQRAKPLVPPIYDDATATEADVLRSRMTRFAHLGGTTQSGIEVREPRNSRIYVLTWSERLGT